MSYFDEIVQAFLDRLNSVADNAALRAIFTRKGDIAHLHPVLGESLERVELPYIVVVPGEPVTEAQGVQGLSVPNPADLRRGQVFFEHIASDRSGNPKDSLLTTKGLLRGTETIWERVAGTPGPQLMRLDNISRPGPIEDAGGRRLIGQTVTCSFVWTRR